MYCPICPPPPQKCISYPLSAPCVTYQSRSTIPFVLRISRATHRNYLTASKVARIASHRERRRLSCGPGPLLHNSSLSVVELLLEQQQLGCFSFVRPLSSRFLRFLHNANIVSFWRTVGTHPALILTERNEVVGHVDCSIALFSYSFVYKMYCYPSKIPLHVGAQLNWIKKSPNIF